MSDDQLTRKPPSYSDPRCADPSWILDQAEKFGDEDDGVPEFLEAYNLKMPTEDDI